MEMYLFLKTSLDLLYIYLYLQKLEKVAIIASHSQKQRTNEIFPHFQFHDFVFIPLEQQQKNKN